METLADTYILFHLGLGFILGMKHALDVDHIVAVSIMVSERKSLLHSTIAGVMWGVGHTAALLAVGVVVLLFNIQVPDLFATWMELGVAVVLIGLGIHLLWNIRRGAVLHTHVHRHGEHLHIHPHLHTSGVEHQHEIGSHHYVKANKKPLLIGMVHGLAGSAALMLLILTTISSRLIGVLYIVIFGIGSILGMALVSMVISIPLTLTGKHSNILRGIQISVAVVSILTGILLSTQLAFTTPTV